MLPLDTGDPPHWLYSRHIDGKTDSSAIALKWHVSCAIDGHDGQFNP